MSVSPGSTPPASSVATQPSSVESYVVLPVKTAAGKTLRALSHLPIETATRTLSVLGYYGSAGVEWTGKNLEWLLNNLPLEEASEIAFTVGDETVKSAVKGTVGMVATRIAAVGESVITKDMPTSLEQLQAVAARASASAVLPATAATIAAQAVVKKGQQVNKSTIIPKVRVGIRKALGYLTNIFGYLKEKAKGHMEEPGWIREQLIDRGDKLLGEAWRINQRAQNYLDQVASVAGQIQKVSSLRITPQMSLTEFTALSQKEKKSILYLVSQATKRLKVTSQAIKSFENALEKFEKNENARVTTAFNALLKEYNKLNQKELLALTPFQYEQMQPQEKTKLIHLVRTRGAALSSDDRKRLLDYQKAITSAADYEKLFALAPETEKKALEIKLKAAQSEVQRLESEEGEGEGEHLFLLTQFNQLPSEVRTALLDISSSAMGEFSFEERQAMIALLITKIAKKLESGDKTNTKTEIRHLTDDLKRLQNIQTLALHNKRDVKKISACFSKYLSAKEKANIRKLFNQKVVTINASPEQLQAASKKLEAELQIKLEALEKSAGKKNDSALLDTAELIESLAMLSQVERQIVSKKSQALPSLPQGVPISAAQVEQSISTNVREKGVIARVSDTAGIVAENILWGAGKGLGIGLHAAGTIASPKRVEFVMNTTAEVVSQLALATSVAKILSAGVTYLGAERLGSSLNVMADGMQQVSNLYVNGIVKAEAATLGICSRLSELEKMTFREYVGPFIDYLVSSTGALKGMASQMDPLTKQLARLQDQFVKRKISAAKLGKRFETYLKKVQKDFGPFISEFMKKNPDSQLSNIMQLNYKSICEAILQANPQLKKGSVKFYEELFKVLQKNWTGCVQEMSKALPFQELAARAPAASGALQTSDLVLQDVRKAIYRVETLEWQLQEAQSAQKVLQVMKKSPLLDLLSRAKLSKKFTKVVDAMQQSYQKDLQARLQWAANVQPTIENSLQIEKSKVANFPSIKDAESVVAKAEPWIPYLGSYIPTLLSLTSTSVDYVTGSFVTKVLTKTATKSLKIMAPWVGKVVQPSLHQLASLSEHTGTALGSFVRSAISSFGNAAEKALMDVAITIYEDDTQKQYIDPARIKNFQSLKAEEKAHLLFISLQSPKAESERIELYRLLTGRSLVKTDPISQSFREQTKEIIALFQKAQLTKENEQIAIRLILQAHDHLNMEERFLLSPVSFVGLEAQEKKRIIDVVHDAVGLVNKGDVEEIVWKFNVLLKEERDAANTITVPEFRTLDQDVQQDLLYRIIFSDVYKKEFLEGISADEVLRQQVNQMRKFQKALPHSDDLERLLRLGARLSDKEKGQLSFVQLQEWGPAKIAQAYVLLEENGKFASLSKKEVDLLKRLQVGGDFPLRGKALVLLSALYNSKLEYFQKCRLFNLTRAELLEFSKKEKLEILDLVIQSIGPQASEKLQREKLQLVSDRERLQQGLELNHAKLLEERFKELPLTKKSGLYEHFKNERKALKMIQEPALKLIEREKNIVEKLTAEIKNIESLLLKPSSSLDPLERTKLEVRKGVLEKELVAHKRTLTEQELLLASIEKQARGENADQEKASLAALEKEKQKAETPIPEALGREMEEALLLEGQKRINDDLVLEKMVLMHYEPLLKNAPLEILRGLAETIPARIATIEGLLLRAGKEEQEELTLEKKQLTIVLELVNKKVTEKIAPPPLTIAPLTIAPDEPFADGPRTPSPRGFPQFAESLREPVAPQTPSSPSSPVAFPESPSSGPRTPTALSMSSPLSTHAVRPLARRKKR